MILTESRYKTDQHFQKPILQHKCHLYSLRWFGLLQIFHIQFFSRLIISKNHFFTVEKDKKMFTELAHPQWVKNVSYWLTATRSDDSQVQVQLPLWDFLCRKILLIPESSSSLTRIYTYADQCLRIGPMGECFVVIFGAFSTTSVNHLFSKRFFWLQATSKTYQGTHKCDSKARCDNLIGNYTCTCDRGYSGDGFKCSGSDQRLST